ncbi:hypothetical protein LZP97_26750 (plasmid) [Rhodococcus sp. DMF-1]|nr:MULTISPECIES: hypothetical protein [Rhodococcus]UIR36942.1 hypothetical protein LZP97_25750 [Rhodococcus sp. DMF-1]UIR39768.1 hypothetical protein LZP97_27165 [Rhodococcus sp. DMF-1]UIR39786.1 hypothetical protein LZP97_26750 [Rhodococcus sp. DMF-1]
MVNPNYHVTDLVPAARVEQPPTPPARVCKICGEPAAPGAYWCRDCRGLL